MANTAKTVFIFGATSAIAQAAGRAWAEQGWRIAVVGRHADRLKLVADDAASHGADATKVFVADMADDRALETLFVELAEWCAMPDVVLTAQGALGDAEKSATDWPTARKMYQINMLSPMAVMTHFANLFAEQKSGSLVAISSVAGDRGRQSNYIYGSAKGGLSLFMQGLRNRMHKHQVQVLTIKPGFVDTPMTAHLPKGPLFASARTVGRGIVRATARGHDVAYLPWFWWGIMSIIKAIPERIFKRLSL